MLDLDDSEKISVSDFRYLLDRAEAKEPISLEIAEKILHEADYNGDGEIDFDEFMKLMYEKIGSLTLD